MASETQAAREPWHTLASEEVAQRLGVVAASGLDDAEIEKRRQRFGPNALPEARRRGVARMIFDQFADFMIMVLIAAAVVSGIVGEPSDTIAIVVIVLLNAVIGVVQEYRAEQAMAALRKLAAPAARVRRGGDTTTVATDKLVPGDIVVLEAGNVVPADLRLIESVRLRIAEAALTGESHGVDKTIAALQGADLALGDRRNMAFKGTLATYGRGIGIVVATGLETELGRIATLLASAEETKTPLQKRLARFGARLAWAVLAICAIVFAAGLARGEEPVLMFLTAVSLAVAAIPEALPAVVAISLALGAYKMVRQHALIRRLPAVETLGSITYICSDKTGTLTQNRMRAEAFYCDARQLGAETLDATREPWATLLQALALNNDATVTRAGHASGEPTEAALLEAAMQAGIGKAAADQARPRLAEIPFDSERKLMTTLHGEGNGVIAFVKGAPEALLSRCPRQLTAAGEAPLAMDEWLEAAERMAAAGLRVLAVAYRRFPAQPDDLDEAESDLVLVGLVGLMDPPRREAKAAVAECQTAGIVPVMITGDHPATARAIARRLGIIRDGGEVMTGTALSGLGDEDFAARVKDIRVYARVDPEQKIRIVRALQARGEFVAMTGDGVNDAPALKRADIGVAMGKGGTDVAREAAHMVLLDDNFATIVHAVREGRRIFDNIRKFIKYTMTSNSGEIWTIFLAPFLGLPIPLLPIHILWINLVTDGLPGLALANEPAERGVMRRPPRAPNESIFAHGMWQHIVWVGLLMGGVSLLAQAWGYTTGRAHWQSMVFTVLCLSQLGHVLAIRSETESLFSIGAFSNRFLIWTVIATVLLQLATLYVPDLNTVFKTQPLEADELLLCLAASTVVFWGVELEKWAVRKGWLYGSDAGSTPLPR